MSTPYSEKSWYARLLGRSLMSIIFGKVLESKNTTASIIAISVVLTVCYAIVFKEKYEYMNVLLYIVFVVIGYYFGAKPGTLKDEDEE